MEGFHPVLGSTAAQKVGGGEVTRFLAFSPQFLERISLAPCSRPTVCPYWCLLQVNGVPATLPVEVSNSLTIKESRGTIWITQEPEFVIGLSPAGEVTVTVARDLSQQVCGMCGNYNGNAGDDLRGPDGKLVGDVVAAAKAWRAPDFTHVSVPRR